jgi:2-oxo-4-hydroxy-4-carboxy-5-ureidoimidazoline decarboxylase
MTVTLEQLNRIDRAGFVRALGGIYEHSPWVAERAFDRRPYASLADLVAALSGAVAGASDEEKVRLVQSHPDLAGRAARAGKLTAASRAEQGALGLDQLSDEEFARFEALNEAYAKKFGFPFVICVRRQTRDAILEAFERRLKNDAATELRTALNEIDFIARLRIPDVVQGPGMVKLDGRLSTHVLDTHGGRPASGVRIELFEVGRRAHSLLTEAVTNADGRTDAPLLAGGPLRIGRYELRFHIGNYFASNGAKLAEPAFLDVIPVRFAISEAEAHYHVPLLVTPWSYSTYRGS